MLTPVDISAKHYRHVIISKLLLLQIFITNLLSLMALTKISYILQLLEKILCLQIVIFVQVKTLLLLPSAPRLTQASFWRPILPTAWQWMLLSGTTSTRRSSSLAVRTGPSRSGIIPSSETTCSYCRYDTTLNTVLYIVSQLSKF